jgi:hypothetical protein
VVLKSILTGSEVRWPAKRHPAMPPRSPLAIPTYRLRFGGFPRISRSSHTPTSQRDAPRVGWRVFRNSRRVGNEGMVAAHTIEGHGVINKSLHAATCFREGYQFSGAGLGKALVVSQSSRSRHLEAKVAKQMSCEAVTAGSPQSFAWRSCWWPRRRHLAADCERTRGHQTVRRFCIILSNWVVISRIAER